MLGDVVVSKKDINSLNVSKITPGIYSLIIEYKNAIISVKIIKQWVL